MNQTHSVSKKIKTEKDVVEELNLSDQNLTALPPLISGLKVLSCGGNQITALPSLPPGLEMLYCQDNKLTILPPLSLAESIEVTKIYSVFGNLANGQSLITTRPFRTPHHTASYVGLIGGGNSIKPGEISLAHRGVLFLDEVSEFS